MGNLTIKYGDTILSEDSGTITKTLKTSGKYCEKNFTVSMTGAENDPTTVSHKRFTYHADSKFSGKWVDMVGADEDIANHLNDDTFTVAYKFLGNPTPEYSTRGGFYCNLPFSYTDTANTTPNYGYCMRTNGSGIGATQSLTNKMTVKTTAVGACYVAPDGAISFFASSTYPINIGAYEIMVWW